MNTHQKITLDINQNASFVYINAKQGDKSTRYVDAVITCDGVKYIPPTDATAYFRCEKSDGTGCSYPATINLDGSVTAELKDTALSAPGDVIADISIEGLSGEVLSTASFVIRVEEIPLGDDIESSNEYVRLLELTNRANEIVSELENATFRTFNGYIQATTDGKTWVDLVKVNTLIGPKGPAGKSAYQYAKEGGYTGTEEEFAEKLAQGTIGATPAFYVTVSPTDSTATDWKADKTVDEIGEAYQAGRPIFCNFYGETGYRMALSLTTWTRPPTYFYSFSGVNSERAVHVNIAQNGVGVAVNDLVTPDDIAAFYVTVEVDSESGGYVADKTVEEIGAAYQEGKPVFCKFIGETSFRMTLLLMTANDYMCSFSGADSVRSVTVNITQTGVGVVVKEILDSGIPIPETAEVGQTIVVKAVDENGKPTEWECADFPEGSGLTNTARTLLMTVLRNGVYTSDQSKNIAALEEALKASGGGSDDPDVPVEPDEPDAPKTYTITNALTNCTNSNSATSIEENTAYTAVITAVDGYELQSVTATMGGSAVTVIDGVISISSVTGNIVVTAVATVVDATEESVPFEDVRVGTIGLDAGKGIRVNTANMARAMVVPVGIYMEVGKTYRTSIGNVANAYAFGVQVMKASDANLTFPYPDTATTVHYDPTSTKLLDSGWQTADYEYLVVEENSVLCVNFKRADAGTMTESDFATLRENFTIVRY